MDRLGRWLRLSLVSALAFACSAPPVNVRDAADANDTGAALAGKTASERSLLSELPRLPARVARRVGDATVVADTSYASASGRTCRALEITLPQPKEKRHRLACSDGKLWFFVPDVFGADTPHTSE